MLRRNLMLAALAPTLALTLAACDGGADEPDVDATDLNRVQSKGEAEAVARMLDAGDFMDLSLGAKIEGPQGPEVKGSMRNAEGAFADIRSYVACPAGMDPCDPANAPAGTVFTYVHVLYPGEDNDPDTGSGTGNDSSDIETADMFRLTQPAHGFTGNAGYSKAEAISAMGPGSDVVITCEDGALAWTVEAGDGGNQWEQAEPLTFWWQSTVPPSGPAEAYEIHANHTAANGSGPYPGDGIGAANACLDPELVAAATPAAG